MQFTRIILSIVFVLFASTALAAKPGKILVCHVGNELGSMDETYQENPECDIGDWVGDPADYICPDAGKVDLILVSTKAKHIGNPAHYFEDDTGYPWADYSPGEGIGDDPADFEEGDVVGIDRGCELEEELLACPCWDTYTEEQLIEAVDDGIGEQQADCGESGVRVSVLAGLEPGGTFVLLNARKDFGTCQAQFPGQNVNITGMGEVDQAVCVSELISLLPEISACD